MRSDHRTRWCRLAVSFLLAALVPAGAALAAPKVVSVWTRSSFNTGESQVLIAAADRFNHAQQAYKVELFASNYRNHADWVQSVATSGSMPCMLELDGPFVARFAWPGYLMPLDRFITPELRRDLLPSVLAQGSFDGQLFSLGQFDSGLGLWANRRHLRAAGVRIPTVAEPWTLDEFEQALAFFGVDKGAGMGGNQQLLLDKRKKVLAELAKAKLDLGAVYTNEFVKKANAKYPKG